MRIVNIRGGCGNQMLQYAFAIVLQEKYPEETVMVDTQLYKYPFVKTFRGNNFYHNGFELPSIFPNAKLPIAKWDDIARVSYYIPNYMVNRALRKFLPQRKHEYIQPAEDAYIYDGDLLNRKSFSYYEGYWFSPSYFDFCKKKIWEIYQFKPFETKCNIELAEKLKSKNSVTIHVRRGDFLNIPKYQGICSIEYYANAIMEIKKSIPDPVFFVFSNDIEWCASNLKEIAGSSMMAFVNNNKGRESYRDMQLMSLARCNILANSTFSWWGAYLNQRADHIVITPKNWEKFIYSNPNCYDWIKL